MAKILVRVGQNQELVLEVSPGRSVFSALREEGIMVDSFCGGMGTCGKCKVTVVSGNGEVTPEEKALLDAGELEKGIRLACYLPATDGLLVELGPSGEMVMLTMGLDTAVSLDPLVRERIVCLPTPTLTDQRDVVTQLLERESLSAIDPHCLPQLSTIPSGAEFTMTIIDDRVEATSLEPSQGICGVAFDIGTTTMAAYLVDLATGEELAVHSVANPQRQYGADVISRIHYGETDPQGALELQQCLVQGLNALIDRLCLLSGRSLETIQLVTIAANTVMLHTLLGVRALGIANAPFAPVFTDQIRVRPEKLGLKMAPNGLVVLLPSVSGYVGADIIGDLLACNFPADPHWHGLLIDIGTNGEIVLGNGSKTVACSTAAGPAFEGANIKHGMPGILGAISSFSLVDQKASFETVGAGSPLGICGSGLISIVAELIEHEFVDSSGAFTPFEELEKWQQALMTTVDGQPGFIVVPRELSATGQAIVLTQKDVREVQLAKGAIQAGVLVLLQEAGITLPQVDQLFLAGGFGNYLNVRHAAVVGLIPKELEDRVTRIGNGAGLGAKLCLVNKGHLERADDLRKTIRYVELSSHLEFHSFFMEAMFF